MEGQKKRSVRTLGGIPVGFGIVSLNKKKEKFVEITIRSLQIQTPILP